jgi:hypothetical protein
MNITTSVLDRINKGIGAALRTEYEVAEPAPERLLVLLKDLETQVRDAKRDGLFAEVDMRIAELLRAAGGSLGSSKDTGRPG